MDATALDAMRIAALADPGSDFYKGIVKMLRDAEASASAAKAYGPSVIVPFQLSSADVLRLEEQFGVNIKLRGGGMRSQMAAAIAGLSFCVDAALMEHATSRAKKILLLDGDLASLVAGGLDGRLVERTHMTPRLTMGYHVEDEAVRRFKAHEKGNLSTSASVIDAEMVNGGGEHYWPTVRRDGPAVDMILVNHFKTSVGPTQLAWLAECRSANVLGAIPFQLDFLYSTEGQLACFPGRFYVDKDLDVITLVPEADAALSISHKYSSLVDFATNNSVTAGGVEFLCEKYMNVRGVLYYSLKRVGSDFEVPEVLRTAYYDPAAAETVRLRFPRIKMSSSGVPVGYTRGEVTMLRSRYEKVLARVATSTSEVVHPAEVMVALMDYNNMVVSTLDSAVLAERMPVEDEEDAALAIALHVNWRRHCARGTFNALLEAVRVRRSARDASPVGLAIIALTAWWHRPRVTGVESDELPVAKVVDWCGNDFSVVVEDIDPWVEFESEVGHREDVGGALSPGLPVPPRGEGGKLERKSLPSMDRSERRVVPVKRRSGCPGFSPAKSSAPAVVVNETMAEKRSAVGDMSEVKKKLRRKLGLEQGAHMETVPAQFIAGYDAIVSRSRSQPVPVPNVDPVSAIKADITWMVSPFERDAAATGYRMAEIDVSKVTEGNLAINDAKRLIPKPRWIRRPKVDLGVEGSRVQSQAALLGAAFKRNIGVPANRGAVDLDKLPALVVEKVIATCFRSDWESIVEKHLNTGMWEPNGPDLDVFLKAVDETKARKMVDEFCVEGLVDLRMWSLMAKGRIKPSREDNSSAKVDHPQTIMFLPNSSVNALYSSMTKRAKLCIDECMRPEIRLNAQESDEEHEEWYNSLEPRRASLPATFSYAADIRCYDRSQEHPALLTDIEFYRRLGLNERRLKIWEETHGPKKAMAMMFGVVLSIVQGGVSGLWKTLLRNGIVNLTTLIMATDVKREDIVMLDIKGDDLDAEFARPIKVETAVEKMSLVMNLSAKFFTNDVRYMCKQFRVKRHGRWYFVADPWPRAQSLCTPIVMAGPTVDLMERWVSLRADLRHYDDGELVDAAAEAAQQYYGFKHAPYGMARALAKFHDSSTAYFSFFSAPERVD